jgi:hypothetical protein
LDQRIRDPGAERGRFGPGQHSAARRKQIGSEACEWERDRLGNRLFSGDWVHHDFLTCWMVG